MIWLPLILSTIRFLEPPGGTPPDGFNLLYGPTSGNYQPAVLIGDPSPDPSCGIRTIQIDIPLPSYVAVQAFNQYGTALSNEIYKVAAATTGDADGDGIPDTQDKCVFDPRNAVSTCDTDADGYGNPCDADFDQNGVVNAVDFSQYFLPAFLTGHGTHGEDMDCNGMVNGNDFGRYFIPKFKGALGGAIPGPRNCTP